MIKLLFFSAAMCYTSGALAQPLADQDSPRELEEIVVTAQKRTESLQDVPISLSVVSAENLQRSGAADLNSLQEKVPNLLIQETPANKSIYIRGFGSAAANFGTDQSVSLYNDNIYQGRARQFAAPLYDIERIEVFRGPQGGLLGKNTSAGAVSVITKDPTASREAGVDATYNIDREGYDVTAFISGPISDTLGGRLAIKRSDLSGYLDNRATGRKDPEETLQSGRVTLSYQPSDDVRARFKLQYDDIDRQGLSQLGTLPGNELTQTSFAADVFGLRAGDKQKSVNSSLLIDLPLGPNAITSTTGYSWFRGVRTTGGAFYDPDPFLSIFRERFEQFSQEIRLTSPGNQRFNYILGGYYDTAKYTLLSPVQYSFFGFLNGSQTGDFHQSATTWSAFALADYELLPKLVVRGSARYTRNEKEGQYAYVTNSGLPLAAPNVIPRQSFDEDTFDPSVTLQYKLTPRTMIYAAVGRGSKGGGFVSNTAQVTPTSFPYRQEQSTNYEVGVKSSLLDNRVTFDLSAFVLKLKDLQVSTFDPVAFAFYTTNAASAQSSGVEGSVQVRPLEGLSLSASAAYLDAKYDDFPGAQCPAQAPPTCNTFNLAGYEIIGASKWSGSASFDYEFRLADNLKAAIGGSAEFRSRYYISNDYSAVYGVQKAYQKYNLWAEVSDRDDRWSLAVIGNNLTDELTQNYSYLFSLAAPAVAVHSVLPGREVLIQASVRF